MKTEKLQDAIGEVRDDFLEDANRTAAKKQSGWTRWAAAAACLCLVVGGVFLLNHSGKTPLDASETLPQIAIPEYEPGGMGFEALMEYRADELENGNPWRESMKLDTLPVYRNGCYDPSGAGAPTGLSEAEMTELLQIAAQALGLEILKTDRDTNATKDKDGSILPGDTIYSIRAVTDHGSLRVYANGSVEYDLPAGSTLPEQYRFTYTGSSVDEAKAAMAYLVETYAEFLNYDHPEIALQGDYTFSGEYSRRFLVYDAAADDETNILNYRFRCAQFAPDDNGDLMLIRLFDGLRKAEKLGDYPLISVAEAQEKLLNGQYQTSVPIPMPGENHIAKVELVYRTGPREETLLPYYRFYVELQDADGWTMAQENGLKTYGAYYVPAIQDAYISNLPTYDGHFN